MPDAVPWTPPAGVLSHVGTPIPTDRIFFAPPPPEIGEVRSAWSTLAPGMAPRAPADRLGMTLVPMLVMGTVSLLFDAGFPNNLPFLSLGLLGAWYAWSWTSFFHTCTYVGAHGLARSELSDDRVPRSSHFRFENAADLRVKTVRRLRSGSYVGTDYEYTWSTARGAPVFSISGLYTEKDDPGPDSGFHHGRVGEEAWTRHLAPAIVWELEEQGSVTFRVASVQSVGVGPGFLHLSIYDQDERLKAEDIASIRLHDGTFSIRRRNTGWLDGDVQFAYADLSNGRLFVAMVEQELGLRIKSG